MTVFLVNIEERTKSFLSLQNESIYSKIVQLPIYVVVIALISANTLANEIQNPQSIRNYTVAITLTSIRDIDDATGTFFADFYMTISWKEQGCTILSGGMESRLMSPEEAYKTVADPQIEFVNLYGREELRRQNEVLSAHSDGRCFYTARYSGMFRSTLDLHRFPFDKQTLNIIMESSVYGISQLRLRPGEFNDINDINDKITDLPEWQIINVRFKDGIGKYPFLVDDETEYSRLTFSIDVSRRSGHYIMRFLLPLILIVMLSWLVFWIGAGELEAQMQVSITCVLSVIAFNFVIIGQLPRTSYLTVFDLWIILSYIFVSLGTFENVLAHYLYIKNQRSAAERVDSFSRIFFPLLYIILNLLILIYEHFVIS